MSVVASCTGDTDTKDPDTDISSGFDPDATRTLERASGATVVVYEFGDIQVHNYNDNPANGVGNATYVIESANSLVLIDSQFFPDSATDFRAYADDLGKPIDRILLTHGHQDHVSGLGVAFTDVTSYGSAGVIAEALADSGSVIDEVLGDTAVIDGVTYNFEVRENLEASEQVIITLPDHGIVALGDLFYNDYHAVMNPGFDGWIDVLNELNTDDVDLFLAGHGMAGMSADVDECVGYLETGRDTFATAPDGDTFFGAMVAAYPDHAGPFLLQLSVGEILYPPPRFEVAFGDCRELAMGRVAPLAALQAQVPSGVSVLSLTQQGTVFEGSDDLGTLITRAVACTSITVDGAVDTDVHFAHVGTPVDTSTLPASPYSTDGNNGADFNNYTFSYVTDSAAYQGALEGAGLTGVGTAAFTYVDTPAGDCSIARQIDVVGGDHGFSASGTIPDPSCGPNDVPYVANWWSVTDGQATVASNTIPGQAAAFLDLAATPVMLDAVDGSSLAGFVGDDSAALDAFGLVGFLPASGGVDMVVTVAGAVQ